MKTIIPNRSSRRSVKNVGVLKFLLLIIISVLFSVKGFAQSKIYATTATIKTKVDNPNYATDANLDNFATLNSYGGVLLNIGGYSAELELEFPEVVKAGTTSFVRIDFDSGVLDKLLGGSLGGVLSGVVGGLIIGNHYFEVGARNTTGTDVLSGKSNVGFTNSNLRLLKDATGKFYVAITPNVDYKKVFIKDFTKAVAVGSYNEMKVYDAFFTKGIDACGAPVATGFDGEGLTLDLLGLGKAGVNNMEYAIDGNINTHSDLTLGVLGVAGSISQNFYFSTTSNPDDDINLKIKTSPALLSANVLNSLFVTAYNDNEPVFTQAVGSLLNLDLLRLLQSGKVVSIPFSPNVPFNQVKLTLNSILSVNLTQTVEVYELTKSAGRPTFTGAQSNNLSICYGASANLTATTNSTNNLLWYDSIVDGNLLQTVSSTGTFNTGALTANKTYYVAAKRTDCNEESGRVPVVVNVAPQINFSATTLANGTNSFFYNKQIDLATGGTGSFTYSVATGSTLPAGLSLSSSGAISGTPTTAGDYTFSISATDSKACIETKVFNLKIVATLAFVPNAMPNGITGQVYTKTTIASATGGTAPLTYSVSNLPPGLSFNSSTLEITGTPTQKGVFLVPIIVVDVNGYSVSGSLSIKITDPLILPAAILANGLVGSAYSTQIIPSATGGTGPYIYSATNLPLGLSFNPSTREITGTPQTAGTSIVKVSVTDADGNTTSTDYSIRVIAPMLLPTATLPDGTVNIVYTPQTLPGVTGGVGPYTYTATGVPAGLNFNPSTREITGTPMQAGTFIINQTATDSEGNKVTQSYTIKVIGTLSLDSKPLADGLLGSPYTPETLPAVVGGVGPYNYSLTGLPPGLNFNTTTRQITGTPTLGGVHNLTLTVSDGGGNTVSANYSINVIVGAPTLASVTICSGKTATLTVTNVQSGVTYNWYPAAGNTALVTNNAGVYITGVLSAEITFYVEAVSGTGVSARTAVVVSINPAPNAPIILTENQNISSGQSTIISASADAGNIINWYSVATGGTVLGTGNNFTTPILNATTIYYAEAVNTNGCTSLARTQVTVTVATDPGTAKCNYPNRQITGITGICLLCSVNGANNAIDGDLNTATRITLAVGVASTGYQRLIFPNAGQATDNIKLYLGLPVGLADLNVLSNITVNVLNGSTLVKSYSLNPALVNIVLLGGNKFSVSLPATGIYDRVEVRFGGVASVLTSLDIFGSEVIYATPTISATPITICSGNTATINVTANGGTTLTWFDQATGGNNLGTGASFTTPVLALTTTYYIEVSRAGCSNTDRIPVTVNVTGVIAAPVLEAIANICAGSSATLSIKNADNALTYNWYSTAAGNVILHTGKTFTTPILNADTDYYVEGVAGACKSVARGVANVKVNSRPILPTVTASSLTVNSGFTSTITASSTESGVIFKWYESATATTPIYTGEIYVTTPLTTTTTYYVEAKSSATSCTSPSRVQITVNVIPSGPPNLVPCEAAISQTNGVRGIALLAGVFNPNLAIDDNKETGSSLVIPVGLLGGSVYQNLGFSQLSSVGDTVKILISSPSKLLSLSLLGNLKLTSYAGASSNNDEIAVSNPLIHLELLSGNTQALISFVPASQFDGVEISLNSGLVGALTSINVNYAHRVLAKPLIDVPNVSVCSGTSAVLKVKNPSAGVTYRWYDENGVYLTGKDGDTFTIASVTAKAKYYVVAVSASNCVSAKAEVNVDVQSLTNNPELVLSSISVCAGSSVILEVKDPVAGYIYKWYDVDNNYLTGRDGTTLTVPAANTSYSVRAESSCGVSASVATANITVGAINPPVVSPVSITITMGSSATLTASTGNPDAVIRWYDSDVAGTLLYIGNILITPPLSATTKYYAEAEVPVCGITSRTSVTVTVDNTEIPLNCGYATTTVRKGTSGVALIAGVYNSDLAIDGLANTGSTLYMPVGLLGASVYHQIGFGKSSNIGDTLRIKITSPGKLLSLSVLPNLKLTTYNGGTSNADETILSSSLISLELLSGGAEAVLSFVPTKAFDAVELTLNSDLAGVLNFINFNYAQMISPAPTVDKNAVNVCENSSTILSVKNPQAGAVYRWYLNNTYINGSDGVSLTTDANLAPGVHQYKVTAYSNGCETKAAYVDVTVIAKPAPPIASTDNEINTCLNSKVVLKVNEVAGLTYNWYDASVAGNVLVSNNSSYATPNALPAGIHNFYVEAVNANNCVSSTRTLVSLTIKPYATATDIVVVGNDKACVSSTVSFTASSTTVTNPKFRWFSDAALTQLVGSDPIFSAVVTASVKYYVVVSGDNKCENTAGNAKEVSVTVNPTAIASDITLAGNTELCAGSALSLTASSTTVTNPIFKWYSDAALTDKVFEGTNYTLPILTASTTYYVTVVGDNKCENTPATAKVVKVTVNPLAVATDIIIAGNTTVCKNTDATLSASSTTVANPIFTWYSDASLTTVVNVGANYTATNVTADATYYVTVKGDGKCENSSVNAKIVSIKVNDYATATDITLNNAKVCSGSGVNLEASSTTVTSPVFTWYSDASLTAVVFTGPTYAIPSLTTTTTFYVTVKGTNKCENLPGTAKVVTIEVNPLATASDVMVNGSTTICAGISSTLTASTVTVTNPVFTWYTDLALSNVAHVGANFTSPVLNNTTTYYVTVKGDNKCENSAATAKVVAINVNPIALATDIVVTGATTICKNTNAVLTASSTTIANPIFTWYSNASLTTVINIGATYTATNLTADATYYVTVKGDGICESSSANAKVVTVKVNDYAVASDIILNTDKVCIGTRVVLNASSTTVTSPVFTWYADASLTSSVFTGPTLTIPSITATTTYYVTVKGANKCENLAGTAKVVTIEVNPLATASDVMVNGSTTICAGISSTLTASTVTVTNPVFTWYTDLALSNVAHVGANFTSPVLNNTTTYYVTVKGDNKCENSAATAKVVAINVNPIALATDIVVTGATTICKNTNAVLTASSTTIANPIFTWYSNASLTTVINIGATYTATNLTADATYYVTVKGDGICESSSANAKVVTVKVNDYAVASDIILNTDKVCIGTRVVLNASSTTVTSPVFTWYADASLTSSVFTGPTLTIPSITATTTYYVTVKGANKCENLAGTAKVITVEVNPLATSSDVIITGNTTICGNTSTTLVAGSTTITNPIFTWYTDVALTNIAHVGANFTSPILNHTTTYYVTVKGDNKCENNPANAKVVVVNVSALPSLPIVSSVGTTICSGSSTTLSITNNAAGITYEWYAAAVGGPVLFSGPSITTPILNTNTDYYVQAVNATGCVNGSGRVKVTVSVNAKPVNPILASSMVNTCTGSSAVITVTNIANGVTYNWYTSSTGGTIVGTGSVFTTPVVNANINYFVEAISGTCISASRTLVSVRALPIPVAPTSVTVAPSPICASGTTTITINNPDANTTYKWYSVGVGGTAVFEGNIFTTPALTTSTKYYIEGVAKDGGCASLTRTMVDVNVLPVLAAPEVKVQSTENNSVTFSWSAVTGATGYLYSIDNGLTWLSPGAGASILTFTVSGLKPDESVTFAVKALGQLACQTSASSTPIIGTSKNPLGNNVYIPNAFTPNNDGKNDVFLIFGTTIKDLKMSIYNQWGQLVFQAQSATQGWDGTYKGVSQPNGVYVYLIEIESKDGTKSTRKGTVTLIR
jgi:gliding motility-associated-like protein